MSIIYKETNVFEEAIKRINMVFDYNDEVIVAMSGGKDSTVVFNLALRIARERNRLPLKVFWLDQEVEWQHTVDYMDKIMRMPEVKPYWFQIPFEFPNNLSVSGGKETILIWDESQKDKWVHPQSDIAITKCPFDISEKNRDKAFYILMDTLPEYCLEDGTESCAVLSGMRSCESYNRHMAIMFGKGNFRGETWVRKKKKKSSKAQVFYPIYDFISDDVWTAIAKNGWEYNKCYDLMYRHGVPKTKMRVSALVHETAYSSIEMLQEFEKDTYNRLSSRISGVSAMSHTFDMGDVIPKELPFMFKDWKEYRDYLLANIIEPKYWEHYRKEWDGQDGDDWYKIHVKEVILNDTCGTINENKGSEMTLKVKADNKAFFNRDLEEYKQYIGAMQNGN